MNKKPVCVCVAQEKLNKKQSFFDEFMYLFMYIYVYIYLCLCIYAFIIIDL